MEKYAVVGFPIAHSFSPDIHNPAFKVLSLDAYYERIEIRPEEFHEKILDLKSSNFKGFNITVPFKKQIIPYLDKIDSTADSINAVNTVKSIDGKWFGYNTDIDGFLDPIREVTNKIKNVLILGAGGAAYAVTYACIEFFKPQKLLIANRNPESAKKLLEKIKTDSVNEKKYLALDNAGIMHEKFDLIVNTTSAGMGAQKEINPLNIKKLYHSETIVYDLIYNPPETLFLKQAKQLGLKYLNGLEMLAGQAKKSFKIWTNQDYPGELDINKMLTEKYFK
ncbi:MAG: shikimate dehydrogenase [Calditrichae bacterium]|nr:shikimate dehydrogenase [Calditrichota bacterium]MCB9057243.1 shikimate dehydrogenase [Calditrichia bacterium]